jgi:hypothetical protein
MLVPSIIARINPPITAEPIIAPGPSKEKRQKLSVKIKNLTYVELVIQRQ